MKKWLIMILVLLIFTVCLLYNDEIVSYYVDHFANTNNHISTLVNNQFAKQDSYQFVQLTTDFVPHNRQDIMNIYYTVINSGMEEFTFYCPKEYKDCITDINYLSDNQVLLSDINNFVPVYNSFDKLNTDFDSLGKVTIHISHNYQASEIEAIEKEVATIIQNTIQDNMTLEDKIKAIHDYIINETKYDINRSDNKINSYHSDTAYGALIEHYAICGGYADSMKLFLDYFQIPNYKISSENHIWNLVYLNNEWYHLDLTWDDPVTSSGDDVLEYDYFLISTEELKQLELEQHTFDTDVYQEAK